MHIKLTEYIRATTLTLNIKDAPMTALPLIKDAFAKLATDLEEMMPEPRGSAWNLLKETVGDAIVKIDSTEYETGLYQTAHGAVIRVQPEEPPATEKPRRGRPPKVKVEEPAPINDDTAALQKAIDEPTPLEAAIAAKAEDEQSQGESMTALPVEAESTHTTEIVTTADTTPVSDSDLQKYCVKLAQHYGGPQKVFDLAKQFVEEGAVPRPSNIKGDDKRWQFIKAVEADSGVRYVG